MMSHGPNNVLEPYVVFKIVMKYSISCLTQQTQSTPAEPRRQETIWCQFNAGRLLSNPAFYRILSV